MLLKTGVASAAITFALVLPATAWAEASGPDFYRVVGVSRTDTLSIRTAPGARARKIGQVPHNARRIRSLGQCVGGLTFSQWQSASPAQRRRAKFKRWCRISWRGVRGWVNAGYLAEDSRGTGQRSAPPASIGGIRAVRLMVSANQQAARVRGTIRGRDAVDYVVRAEGGQTMTISLQTSNGANYFNLLPPGSRNAAIFTGSTSGKRFRQRLAGSGDYRIRVYLMRSAARRNEVARYVLTVSLVGHVSHRSGGKVDARGRMPCSIGRPGYNQSCAWTVMRQASGNATLRITKPDGRVRVLQFRRGEFTSGQARMQYRKSGDFWLVSVNDREFYRFSNAVFTGG